VLLKEGGLNHEEICHMREHPLVGEDILDHIEQMKDVKKILRAHHEKWDGSGYPDGLKGVSIPLHARIIAIADTFDAITTDPIARRRTGNPQPRKSSAAPARGMIRRSWRLFSGLATQAILRSWAGDGHNQRIKPLTRRKLIKALIKADTAGHYPGVS